MGRLNGHGRAASGRLQRLAKGWRARRCAHLQSQVRSEFLDSRSRAADLPKNGAPQSDDENAFTLRIAAVEPGLQLANWINAQTDLPGRREERALGSTVGAAKERTQVRV